MPLERRLARIRDVLSYCVPCQWALLMEADDGRKFASMKHPDHPLPCRSGRRAPEAAQLRLPPGTAHGRARALARTRAPYCTSNDTGGLQFSSPVFTTGRYLKSTVVPAFSPWTVVFACRLSGSVTQVVPLSRLYSHE